MEKNMENEMETGIMGFLGCILSVGLNYFTVQVYYAAGRAV